MNNMKSEYFKKQILDLNLSDKPTSKEIEVFNDKMDTLGNIIEKDIVFYKSQINILPKEDVEHIVEHLSKLTEKYFNCLDELAINMHKLIHGKDSDKLSAETYDSLGDWALETLVKSERTRMVFYELMDNIKLIDDDF